MQTRASVELKRVPLLVSYCHNIPEARDMSALRQGVPAKRSFVVYRITRKYVISGKMSSEMKVKDHKMTRSRVLKFSKNRT